MNRATYSRPSKAKQFVSVRPSEVHIPQTNKPPLLACFFQQTKKKRKRKQESQIILIPQARQTGHLHPCLPCSCPDAGETLKYMYAAELAPLKLYRKNYRTGSGSKKNTRVKMKIKATVGISPGNFPSPTPGMHPTPSRKQHANGPC